MYHRAKSFEKQQAVVLALSVDYTDTGALLEEEEGKERDAREKGLSIRFPSILDESSLPTCNAAGCQRRTEREYLIRL